MVTVLMLPSREIIKCLVAYSVPKSPQKKIKRRTNVLRLIMTFARCLTKFKHSIRSACLRMKWRKQPLHPQRKVHSFLYGLKNSWRTFLSSLQRETCLLPFIPVRLKTLKSLRVYSVYWKRVNNFLLLWWSMKRVLLTGFHKVGEDAIQCMRQDSIV